MSNINNNNISSEYFIGAKGKGPSYNLLDEDQQQLITTNPKNRFKIVIVGDSGCGKTSLLSSYIRGSFPDVYEPTIFENHRAYLQKKNPDNSNLTSKNINNPDLVCLDLWDTAGQEDYERLRRLSYEDSNLVIIAYSVGARETLLNIPEVWAPEVLSYCPDVPIILVGLKADLPIKANEPGDSLEVAKRIGAVAHIEVSAKEMYHVNTVFDTCINIILNNERMNKRSSVLENHQTHRRFPSATLKRNSMKNNNNNNNTLINDDYDISNINKNNDDYQGNDNYNYQHDYKEKRNCCVIV